MAERKSKTYTAEFKVQAVKLAQEDAHGRRQGPGLALLLRLLEQPPHLLGHRRPAPRRKASPVLCGATATSGRLTVELWKTLRRFPQSNRTTTTTKNRIPLLVPSGSRKMCQLILTTSIIQVSVKPLKLVAFVLRFFGQTF